MVSSLLMTPPSLVPPPPAKSFSCLFFLPVVTKGFVYSSFLKPYNARRSHSDVSVGSHSSTESEHSSSSPRFPRQNSNSTLTFNPSSMAVAFTSGPCQKQPQDASSLKELDQATLSASLNMGSSESSPSSRPSDPHSTSQPRPWDSADVAQDVDQPAPTLRSYRNSQHLEMAGCSVPGRNGQDKDLVKGCARTAQSLEDKNEELESSEALGNQVSAPCSPRRTGGRCVVGADNAFLGWGRVRGARAWGVIRRWAHRQILVLLNEQLNTSQALSVAGSSELCLSPFSVSLGVYKVLR